MAGFPRATRPRAAARRLGVLAAALAVLVTVVALVGPPGRVVGLLVSLAGVLAVHLAVRHLAVGGDREGPVWRSFARAAAALGVGIGVELVLAVAALVADAGRGTGAAGPPPGLAVGLGAMVACPMVYQGLVHWNRSRTRVSDPGDWLNGLASVTALVAIGVAVMVASDSPLAQWPTWQLVVWLAQSSALIVLGGTAFTIISLGGLERDPRSWTVAGAITVASAVQVVAAWLARGAPSEAAVVTGRAAAASWALAMLGVLVASWLPVRVRAPREATSESTTTGAITVLVASVALVVRNAVVADPALRWSTAVAAVAAGLAMVRMFRVVSELAQLALSRVEARTDELTGVANRRKLMETLAALDAIATSVVLVDLERFKEVNDRFGHAGGDEVIRVVAGRLAARAGHGTLARLGGDEFALVLPRTSLSAAAEIAQGLLECLAEPLKVGDETLRMAASIGVAETSGGAGHEDLMRRADAAMYRAKRAGGGVRLYDEDADTQERAERQLLADLRELLGNDPATPDRAGSPRDVGAIVVHYQPMVDARTRQVVGVEALVRWAHPDRGLLGPFAFLDLAERHGLMSEITARVLDEAVGEVATWRDEAADVRLSVNLSGSCLEGGGLFDVVVAALARHDVAPGRLVLEITETTVVMDAEGAVEVAERLAALGVAISIDDYGTGYSSLARVLAFPAEELKLDRSFTLRVTADARTAALVAGTIDFAHRLGLRVVAEGVEDESTFEAVAALGCDVTQGYLHGRPLPAEELRAWFARRTVRSGG